MDTRERLAESIPNRDFYTDLELYMASSYDIVMESLEPQVGKTKVILMAMWLSQHVYGKEPILIINNHLNALSQFKHRLAEFNRQYNPPIKPGPCVICHELYLECLLRYLESRDNNVCLFLDEADHSVIGITDSGIREDILRNIIDLLTEEDKIVYVSATCFSVVNSPHRNLRPTIYLPIPNDLYHGLEYRGIFHPSNIYVYTDCLNVVHDMRKVDDEAYNRALNELTYHLRRAAYSRYNQPPLVLLNAIWRKEDMRDLADHLRILLPMYNVIVYTGDGVEDGTDVHKVYIGQYLQYYKDNHTKPLIILAKNMASRSQTFRPLDNTWKITHMFVYLKSNAENIIQSFRSNGQYLPDAPPLTIYIQPKALERLKYALLNKKTIMNKLSMISPHIPFRDVLPYIPLHTQEMIPFTRKRNIDYNIDYDKAIIKEEDVSTYKDKIVSTLPDGTYVVAGMGHITY